MKSEMTIEMYDDKDVCITGVSGREGERGVGVGAKLRQLGCKGRP